MRRGFTLVELLVTVAIMLILAGIVVGTVAFTTDHDRATAAARQVQSMLAGAKDRAIFNGSPVGVRFLVDEDDPSICTSMVYVEQLESVEGRCRIGADSQTLTLVSGPSWDALEAQDVTGDRIMLGRGSASDLSQGEGRWYVIASIGGSMEQIGLVNTHDEGLMDEEIPFRLELTNAVMPSQDPVTLPRNTCIVFDRSQLPASWDTSGGWADITFRPGGSAAQSSVWGVLHFLVADRRDWNAGNVIGAGDLNVSTFDAMEYEAKVVTVITSTGRIKASPLDPSDPDSDGIIEDVFGFAEGN